MLKDMCWKVNHCVALPTQNLGGASQTLTQEDATAGVLTDVTVKKVVSANVLAEDNAIVIVKNLTKPCKTCMNRC